MIGKYNTPMALAVPEGVMPMGMRRIPSRFGWRKYPVMTCTARPKKTEKRRGGAKVWGEGVSARHASEDLARRAIASAHVHVPNLVDKAIAAGNDNAIRRRTVQAPHIFDSKAAVFSRDDGVPHFRQLEDRFHHVLNKAFGSAGAEKGERPGQARDLKKRST